MLVFALAAAAISLTRGGPGTEPLRLKSGDTIAVTSPYGGEFRIMPDGAIYGRGFGRLVLAGDTWQQAQDALRKALRPFVREDEVDLTIKDIRHDVVYLVGMNAGKGPVDLVPNLSLRQLLSAEPLDENTDLLQVDVFRNGAKLCSYDASKLISGDPAAPDQALEADDVVTVSPAPFMRVWVTGLVTKSGQLKVPAGTDVYKAIAESGGIKMPELDLDTTIEQEGRIVVRRGPDTFELPLRQNMKAQPFVLESGDTVSVIPPEERRITIAGEVSKPGEVVMRGDHTLAGAIAMAGGCDSEGTLANVLVFRKGEAYQIDATPPTDTKSFKPFALESGDLVYVQRNVRTFLVLGEVAKPGKVVMKDGRTYRLSDALAEAGGLSGRGTLRRVYVTHPGEDGKIAIAEYNLDEFLKDGTLAANPEIQPGQCILFGQPSGITLGTAVEFFSGALLFENLAGGIRK
ncbi:MAG TPA: SLBB domain-containing protein [Fimbriimonadaceae bacterium]|nr:SLBB domain-containing protein [Fimbriimonadaceae bacterium]